MKLSKHFKLMLADRYRICPSNIFFRGKLTKNQRIRCPQPNNIAVFHSISSELKEIEFRENYFQMSEWKIKKDLPVYSWVILVEWSERQSSINVYSYTKKR